MAVIERLTRVLEADYIPVWLNKPSPTLDHEAPLDVLAADGYERVSALVSELEHPPFA